MKKLNLLFALIIVGAVCFSCKKTEQEQIVNSPDRTSIQDLDLDLEKMNQRFDIRVASLRAYQEQLAHTANANRDCMDRVIVPDDAPTIQEAIEMVCEYGEVVVNSGTYAESVMVAFKQGIHIRAAGTVILNGDVFIAFGADNTILEGFNIILPDYPWEGDAVALYYASGCSIKNNIISNQAYPGIEDSDYGITIWEAANNNQIKDNVIADMFLGIDLGNLNTDQTCSDNMIMGNLVSNSARGIVLIFDCDNNTVIGNQINNSYGPVEVGIVMTGINFPGSPFFVDNNQVKLNEVSQCVFDGIYMDFAFDNMIGPNNTCNYNGRNGITLLPSCTDNNVINNEALYNTGFDIWNGGVNNKFRANTAVNTYGI